MPIDMFSKSFLTSLILNVPYVKISVNLTNVTGIFLALH